jgi:hypothetical protein
MRRTRWTVWAAAVLALTGGCATAPVLEAPPDAVPPPIAAGEGNPMYVALGASFESYRKIQEVALSTLTDFGFEILASNAYDGEIETLPRVAPGVLRPLRPGNTAVYDRVLMTFQTYRHRAFVKIQPAQNGGYWLQVVVFRELEDLPRPTRALQGGNFRSINNVERQFEVIDPTFFEATQIPKGRDASIEQQLLARMKKCL